MSTVLLAEEAVREMALEETSQIPVTVTLLIENGIITFQAESSADYKVTGKTIHLFGSGGTPREFVLTFVLSQTFLDMGWKFANPALKFFQGNSKKAGFRFPPEASQTEARLSVFNTLDSKDSKVEDSFNILLLTKDGVIVHDPTIVWDLPGGG
jgi:hypothetical protein